MEILTKNLPWFSCKIQSSTSQSSKIFLLISSLLIVRFTDLESSEDSEVADSLWVDYKD